MTHPDNPNLRIQIHRLLSLMNHSLDGQAQNRQALEDCWEDFIRTCLASKLPLRRTLLLEVLSRAEKTHQVLYESGRLDEHQLENVNLTLSWILNKTAEDTRLSQ